MSLLEDALRAVLYLLFVTVVVTLVVILMKVMEIVFGVAAMTVISLAVAFFLCLLIVRLDSTSDIEHEPKTAD